MSRRAKQNIWLAVKILIGLTIIFPLVITLIFSFQPEEELLTIPLKVFTKNPTLSNYKYAFENYNLFNMLKNTMITIIIIVPVQVLTSSMCAYAFAHFNFRFKNILFTIIITAMMIPGETTLASTFKMVQGMGLINTYLGMCITSLISVSGTFMIRQHMMSLPSALWDAARVDGCSHMKYFFSVMLPLSKSIISAFVLTGFIGVYNSYFWPWMITTTEDMQTLAVGMGQIKADTLLHPGHVYAGTVLCMIVPVIIYIFGIDYIVEGMTAGAVKS